MEKIVVIVVVDGRYFADQSRRLNGVKRMEEIGSDGHGFSRPKNHEPSGRKRLDRPVARNADWRPCKTFIGPGVYSCTTSKPPLTHPVNDVFCLDEMTMKGRYLVLANEYYLLSIRFMTCAHRMTAVAKSERSQPYFLESPRIEIGHVPSEPAFTNFVNFRSQRLPILRSPVGKRREREVVVAEEESASSILRLTSDRFIYFALVSADSALVKHIFGGWPPVRPDWSSKIAIHPSKSTLALSSMERAGKNSATVTQPITDAGGLGARNSILTIVPHP